MKHHFPSEIALAISKVVGRKKCSLHEPWFDKSEIKYVSSAIKNNSVSTYGKETEKFDA